jgi:GTP cyclohydrolase I
MNAIVQTIAPLRGSSPQSVNHKPSQQEIEHAFSFDPLLDRRNPDRDGLRETPARLVRAFQEYFCRLRPGP